MYNGASKEDYQMAAPLARESNRRSVITFSLIGFNAFLIAAIMKSGNEVGMGAAALASVSIVMLAMASICYNYGKKRHCLCELFSYVIVAVLLGVGIYSSISQPTQRTTLLLPFFVLSSMMFYSRTLWHIVITIAAELVFLCLLYCTQEGQVLFENMCNSVIFSLVGVCSSVYLARTKCERFLYEVKRKNLLEKDTLTSMYNRYSFNLEAEKIAHSDAYVTVCSFDVNGLKKTNDTLGHLAGDELIVACAQCIKEVFGCCGNVFRVGGDEFIAILNRVDFDEKELFNRLKQRCAAWKGEYIDGFTVSCGIAKSSKDMPFEEVLKLSDSLMYEDKKHYYDEARKS